jgi:hypothetical protein
MKCGRDQNPTRAIFLFLLFALYCGVNVARAQTAAFTYQGKLTDAGNSASGNYDLQFKLFDTPAVGTGTQQGATLVLNPVAVSAGLFSVQLDFGANVLDGADRYLEIAVRPAGSASPYTVLAPRQPLTSTPYAIRTLAATMADGLSAACVGCVTSTQIGSLPASNGNYVQNSTSEQAGSNFNISGNGTAGGTLSSNIVDATLQYNLGGSRILSNAGQRNLFAGEGAGQADASNGSNAFFGYHAGMNNTIGVRNNFFGSVAGERNTTGYDNNFFGDSAGRFNTGGARNSYYGSFAGQNNSFGADNAFFGYQAGLNTLGGANSFFGSGSGVVNTTGIYNAFFGFFAGANSTTALQNTFIGASAGEHNHTGSYNTFVGYAAGDTHDSGENNTALGFAADVLSGLRYATAIGSNAIVSTSNTIVLGRQINQTSADSVGIGIPNPARTLDVSGRARVRSIPLEASGAAVCFNFFGDLLQCGASSLRLKRNVRPYRQGLDIVQRLRPISFIWKADGRADFGLGAEDVARVAPELAFTNEQGEPQGVKYEKLSLLLINAVQELRAENEALRRRLQVLERRWRRTNR